MKRTPLYNFHIKRNAKMVDFAGWEMPLLYTSIVEEHHHTRNVASLFDVSHMGRVELRGGGAETLLERVCTRRLRDAAVGQSRYSHVCNDAGGILDDIIVSRFEDHWLVVCNAGNREKIVAWLRQHARDTDVEIDDRTENTLMVALQGPTVIEKLGEKLPFPLRELKRYRFLSGDHLSIPYALFRSGYTGEDGVELILPALVGPMVAEFIVAEQESGAGPLPAGLGARDTLRIEAAMPLYGHELHEHIDSISAGLAWCVELQKDFIGADALRKIAQDGPRQQLIGLELDGRRIARQHAKLYQGEQAVGEVTSGTFSPTLQRSIAMAYVTPAAAPPGTALSVELGGKRVDARAVKLPFYKRGQ